MGYRNVVAEEVGWRTMVEDGPFEDKTLDVVVEQMEPTGGFVLPACRFWYRSVPLRFGAAPMKEERPRRR